MKEGYLKVSARHEIYYATYGNPEGLPVIVLHGGPGAGTHATVPTLFDLERYYLVTFDQRGAMRSRPFACMEENTTSHLISDIEALRKHLGIDRWVVFGGSWGALLSILYGEAHPERPLGFILRGIFLGRKKDVTFCQQVEEAVEPFEAFQRYFPEEERGDLLQATYRRVMDPDPKTQQAAADAFMRYWTLSTTPDPEFVEKVLQDSDLCLSITRAAMHYSAHHFFIEENQALAQLDRITHHPCTIIHGAKDRNCSSNQASLLHKEWPGSNLSMIEEGGHFAQDPLISAALKRATHSFAEEIR